MEEIILKELGIGLEAKRSSKEDYACPFCGADLAVDNSLSCKVVCPLCGRRNDCGG